MISMQDLKANIHALELLTVAITRSLPPAMRGAVQAEFALAVETSQVALLNSGVPDQDRNLVAHHSVRLSAAIAGGTQST